MLVALYFVQYYILGKKDEGKGLDVVLIQEGQISFRCDELLYVWSCVVILDGDME